MILCYYGCGQEAKYQFKNGKWCCSKYYVQCPVIREKMSGENNSKGMLGKHQTKEARKNMGDKKRSPFEKIIKYVEDENYELLTKKEEYENIFPKKLWFRCPEGHEFPARWDGPKIGCRCPECAKEQRKTPFKEIIKDVENESYELLSKEEEYKNAHSKLWFRCPEGHEFPTSWNNFKNCGQRCPKCANKKSGENRRKPFEEIIKFTEGEGYELLSEEKEYKNAFSKLWFRCPEGHEYPARWDNFKNLGQRCPECFKERMREIGITPNYNPLACKLIDKYGKEHNYNFQHAENGGEFHIMVYWVDGYDKERNTVIEIDELFHFDKNGNLKEKDIQRQKEITDFLGCKFIRLKI